MGIKKDELSKPSVSVGGKKKGRRGEKGWEKDLDLA